MEWAVSSNCRCRTSNASCVSDRSHLSVIEERTGQPKKIEDNNIKLRDEKVVPEGGDLHVPSVGLVPHEEHIVRRGILGRFQHFRPALVVEKECLRGGAWLMVRAQPSALATRMESHAYLGLVDDHARLSKLRP